MIKGLLTSLFLLLFVPVLSVAAEIELNHVINALETPFKSQTKISERIHDFHADFFQRSHIASIGRTQHGQGTVSFKFVTSLVHESSLAKFRWQYREPSIQEIISDGQTLWVYLPENRQVIESDITKIDAQQGENPVTFLSGLGNLSRDFSINWGFPRTVESGGYRLLLEPRKKSQFIQQIEVVVSEMAVNSWLEQHKTGEIFPILTTLITDPSGNRTAIEFRDVQVNQELADRSFSFERPEGVELVHHGEQMSF
ncbi:MAG: outer membrane lipoprotein carrier protein LolA [Thermodesulfobacteriota bacterium]|nr:outer membrane lipoprotein carrier protein LolA [Thermodesulfobacteriota bacterium]